MSMLNTNIKTGSLNLQGDAQRKLSNVDVKNFVHKLDIVCLQETWLTDRDGVANNGYNMHRSDRKKNKRRYCGSGGVITLCREYYESGVTKINSKSSDLMWMKLDRTYFNLARDIYLCNCYIPPYAGSSYNNAITNNEHREEANSHIEILKKEVELYSYY